MAITKINNLGITDGTIVNADISASAAIASTKLTGINDAKAWVNFNGESTVSIRASFNVSSITDNGTGDYTVNFTTSFADVNYATSAFASMESGGTDNNVFAIGQKGTVSSNYTVSSCRLQMRRLDQVDNDCRVVTAIFFR